MDSFVYYLVFCLTFTYSCGEKLNFQNNGNQNVTSQCRLRVADENVITSIIAHSSNGTKLIEYYLTILGYNQSNDPLDQTLLSRNYKPHIWIRIFQQHALTLLALDFNYDILSIKMLQVGVQLLPVQLIENEEGCFDELTEEKKVHLLRDLVLRDFKVGILHC